MWFSNTPRVLHEKLLLSKIKIAHYLKITLAHMILQKKKKKKEIL